MRRVVEQYRRTYDSEILQTVTVYEEGIKKRDVKNKYTQIHSFLVKRRSKFKIISEKA